MIFHRERGLSSLLCLLFCGCSLSEPWPGDEVSRSGVVGWVKVGSSGEYVVGSAPASGPDALRKPVGRSLAVARGQAVEAWRAAPTEGSALGLARAYFPEFSEEVDATEAAPVNPAAALRVKLPAAEGEEMEVATRGYVFKVKQVVDAVDAVRGVAQSGAAFYGRGHFWTAVGGKSAEEGRLLSTYRVEEYILLDGAGSPSHRERYVVTVPAGVTEVRDAGAYLEFLTAAGLPVLRLHYPVARDSSGRSRQGKVRLLGVVARGVARRSGPARYALETPVLRLEMEVSLQELAGPVVIDPGWSSTGIMATARHNNTATLLPSGKVLVAGGCNPSDFLATAELYDPQTGNWATAGAMTSARCFHTATLLPSGKALVAGGVNNGGPLATAELYDPGTGTWASTGPMASSRRDHTATLLPSGRVLVTGGGGDSYLATAELYDPGAGGWTTTGSMASARYFHTATLLSSGKVLVAGGHNPSGLATAELYDPEAGSWGSTGTMTSIRANHTATLLPSGKVLVAGGTSGPDLATAELYDPGTGSWKATGAMASVHSAHTATLLPSGKVLVTGGYNLATAELYDPETGSWATTGTMASTRSNHTATLLPSGKVLVAGNYEGGSSATAELYDPGAGSWASAGTMARVRANHAATLLPSGKVLVSGGYNGSTYLGQAEVYDPGAANWSPVAAMASARANHTVTLLTSGKVLVTGGYNGSTALATAELYDPGASSWSSGGTMVSPREGHTATLLPSGNVLVTGGDDGSTALATAELYCPLAVKWAAAGMMAMARVHHTATLLPSGKVLVAGGYDGNTALATAELYDPWTGSWTPVGMTGNWTPVGRMASARGYHTATLLPSGKVLVAGGTDGSTTLATAELYDPATGSWTPAGTMNQARAHHTATLLPSGKVLVAGGSNGSTSLSTPEVYDPATGSWTTPGSLVSGRENHTATLLASGKVLVVGGGTGSTLLATAEMYDDTGANDAWRPLVSPPGVLGMGTTVTVTGKGFRGVSEANSGYTHNSSTNFPLVGLNAVEGGRLTVLPGWNFSDTSVTATAPFLPGGFYRLIVTTNAIPGGTLVQLLDTTPPAVPVVEVPANGTHVNTKTPVISGKAEAHSMVSVSLDGVLIGGGMTGDDGEWSFTPASPLAGGFHTVKADAMNAVGNRSAFSSDSSFSVDVPPAAPAAPVLVVPSDGAKLYAARPTFSGTAGPGSTVTLSVDGANVATAPASASGEWSISVLLREGQHTASALATNAVGTAGPSSPPITFTVIKRGYYGWGCTTAPDGTLTWLALVLGLWLSRPRGPRVSKPALGSLPGARRSS